VKVRHYAGYPNVDGPVCLIVPGRYYAQHTDQINQAIKRFVSVLMVVTSDEEALFDIWEIRHDRIKFMVQTPRQGRDYGGARLFGVGFPPHFNDLPAEPSEKLVDVYLSAQNTHVRRSECFEALKDWPDVFPTDGFTSGVTPEVYAGVMSRTKVAPCPSGAVSPDSFRLFEALEAHCVPIADTVSPVDGLTDYWDRVLPGHPFPTITDYADLAGYIGDVLKDWPANANRLIAWWYQQKRRYAHWLVEDLEALCAL
jgi:hypothetical protein